LVVGSSLLVARGEATKLFVAVDESLNLVPLAIADAVEGTGAMFRRLPRNGDAEAMAPHVLADLATAIRLVAHEAVWPVLRPASTRTLHTTVGDQLGKDDGFLPLAWRQQYREELAPTVSPEVEFGAEAASAPPERFGLGSPLLAPAACWWARTIVLSRKCMAQSSRPVASACCFRVSNSR